MAWQEDPPAFPDASSSGGSDIGLLDQVLGGGISGQLSTYQRMAQDEPSSFQPSTKPLYQRQAEAEQQMLQDQRRPIQIFDTQTPIDRASKKNLLLSQLNDTNRSDQSSDWLSGSLGDIQNVVQGMTPSGLYGSYQQASKSIIPENAWKNAALTGEEVQSLSGLGPKTSAVLAGTEQAVLDLVSFFTSPVGILTLGIGTLPKAGQRAVAVGFATDMLAHAPEQAAQLGQAIGEGNIEQATRAALGAGAGLYFAKKSAEHAVNLGGPPDGPPGSGTRADLSKQNVDIQATLGQPTYDEFGNTTGWQRQARFGSDLGIGQPTTIPAPGSEFPRTLNIPPSRVPGLPDQTEAPGGAIPQAQFETPTMAPSRVTINAPEGQGLPLPSSAMSALEQAGQNAWRTPQEMVAFVAQAGQQALQSGKKPSGRKLNDTEYTILRTLSERAQTGDRAAALNIAQLLELPEVQSQYQSTGTQTVRAPSLAAAKPVESTVRGPATASEVLGRQPEATPTQPNVSLTAPQLKTQQSDTGIPISPTPTAPIPVVKESLITAPDLRQVAQGVGDAQANGNWTERDRLLQFIPSPKKVLDSNYSTSIRSLVGAALEGGVDEKMLISGLPIRQWANEFDQLSIPTVKESLTTQPAKPATVRAPARAPREKASPEKAQQAKLVAEIDAQRPPDLLDYLIDNRYKVRGKGITKEAGAGFYQSNEWKEMLAGPAKVLFTNEVGKDGTPKGIGFDDLRQRLADANQIPADWTVGDLQEHLAGVVRARQKFVKDGLRDRKLLDEMAAQHTAEDMAGTVYDPKRMTESTDFLPPEEQAQVQTPASTTPTLRPMENQGDLLAKQKESFALAQETGTDFARIQKAKEDAAKAKAESAKLQGELPGTGETPKLSLATSPILKPATERMPQGAVGLKDIRMMVNHPDSGLSATQKLFFNYILDQPVMKDARLGDLSVWLKDSIDGNPNIHGRAYTTAQMVELARTGKPEAIPHEIGHILEAIVPEDILNMFDQARRAAVTEALSKFREDFKGQITDADRAWMQKIMDGTMSSREFNKLGLWRELYRLSNNGEFFADFLANEASRRAFESRNQSWFGAVRERFMQFIRAIGNAFKQALGGDTTQADMVRAIDDLLAGRFKGEVTPETGARFEEQLSIVRSEKEAKEKVGLFKTPRESEIEGLHQLAQSVDISASLASAGAGNLSDAAKNKLNLGDWIGIANVGQRLAGIRAGYQTVKQQFLNAGNTYGAKLTALFANARWNDLTALRDTLKKESDAATKKLTSPSFQNKLARESQLEYQKLATNNAATVTESVLASAMHQATQALKQERLSDIEIARLEGELAGVDQARKSSSAMSQLMTDMVNVLSSTQEGVQLLSDPNFGTRTDILKAYTDLKVSTGQTLHNPNLLKWATFVLQKSKEVRDDMFAAQLARNSQVRNGMNAFQTRFLADFERDPVKAMGGAMRQTARAATLEERARFAWLQLHKEVVAEMQDLADSISAHRVIDGALNDPRTKALLKEIRQDAGQIGLGQQPVRPLIDKTILMPDGKTVDISTETVTGDNQAFSARRAEWEQAASTLETWLNDPANIDHPNWEVHRRNLETVMSRYLTMSVLNPTDRNAVFGRAFHSITGAINEAGGRVAAMARQTANRYNRVRMKASWFNQRAIHEVSESLRHALASHDLEFNPENARLYALNVGNQLASSWQRQQGGLGVGDSVGGNGWKVTAADMANLKRQTDITTQGFSVLGGDQITKDTLSVLESYRKAQQTSPYMVPRMFDDALLKPFVAPFLEQHKAFRDAMAAGDQQAADAARNAMLDILDQNWKRVGYGLIWDRDPQFASATDFDGPGGAFDVITRRMDATPNAVSSGRQLMQELSSLSTLTPEASADAVFGEWAKFLGRWRTSAEPEVGPNVRPEEVKNSFTRSRNEALAPYLFYQHGFPNTDAVTGFATGIFSRASDEMISGLKAVSTDLQRQIDDLKAKSESRLMGGGKGTRQAVVNENAIERFNGETYDNYKNLARRKSFVDNAIGEMTNTRELDVDGTLQRNISAVTSSLLGIVATGRNILTGPIYLGMALQRLGMSGGKAYGLAAWEVLVKAQLETALKSGVFTLPRTVGALAKGSVNLLTTSGSFGTRYNAFLRGVVHELGTKAYERNKMIKAAMDAGLIYVPDQVKEFDNRVLGSAINQGLLPENEKTAMQRAGQGPAAVFENTALALTRTYAPSLGDAAFNAAAHDAFLSSFGPIQQIENRLRLFMAQWQQSHHRPIDFQNVRNPSNRFAPQELDWTHADLTNVRRSFEQAGLNFDEKAVEFLRDVQANRQARFLSDPERNNMTQMVIDYMNRSSATGRPLNLDQRTFLPTIVAPFMGWKVRTLAAVNDLFSVPSQGKNRVNNLSELQAARAKQWLALTMKVGLPFILASAGIAYWTEKELRVAKKALFNQVTASRLPTEYDSAAGQMKGWAIYAAMGIPFIDMLASYALNDLPNRASLDPSLVVIEKLKDAVRYVGGVMQTGKPTYGLANLVTGIVPDSKIVLSRIESESGKRATGNEIALMRRFGPVEMLRGFGANSSINLTPLSPYGAMLENAAINGDDAQFTAIYREAVQKAAELGKPDPEKAVQQLFQSRNPYDRAFKEKLTPEQRQEFIAKLSPTEQSELQTVEDRFTHAANLIGRQPTFELTPERAAQREQRQQAAVRGVMPVGGNYSGSGTGGGFATAGVSVGQSLAPGFGAGGGGGAVSRSRGRIVGRGSIPSRARIARAPSLGRSRRGRGIRRVIRSRR